MRALVLRLSSLGDVVLAEPVLRALSAHGYDVHFVTDARYAGLAQEGFTVERVIVDDRHGGDSGRSGLSRVVDRIAETAGVQPYDVIVDLQGSLRTRWVAFRVRGDKRLTLRKRSSGRAMLALVGRDPPLQGRHATTLYLDVLSPLDLAPVDPAPRLAGRCRSRAPIVALGPAARHATKRWSTEKFGTLAARICAAWPQTELLLVGGPEDRGLLQDIRARSPSLRWSSTDVTCEGTEVLARHIGRAWVYVGVDSGPAHVAAALGVPTVVLFGPTSSRRWGPLGPLHRVVERGLDCAPCSNFGGAHCPRIDRDHACMKELSAEGVFGVMQPLLEGQFAPRALHPDSEHADHPMPPPHGGERSEESG